MFRFILRRRARLTRPGTLATVSLGALALQASSNDPTQPDLQPHPDQPPLTSLLRAYLVFTLCSSTSLVNASPSVLSFLSTIPVLRDVTDAFLKVTFFDQFVGAETVDACIPLLHKLRRSNQGVLFAYSVERPHGSSSPEPTPDPSKRALESILRSIDIAADFEDSLSTSASHNSTSNTGTWVAVKLSTLLPNPSALRVLSDWIVRKQIKMEPQLQIPFPGAPDAQDFQIFLRPKDDDANTNIVQHLESLQTLHTDLRKICTRAQDRGIRLTVDAEETWFQPAIDLFSVLLMQEFNSLKRPTNTATGTSPTRALQPLVYTTLQAYLIRSPAFLDFLIKHAKHNEYSLGVKLVRGAYIDAELDAHAHRDRLSGIEAIKSESISPDENAPMYPNKASTDAAYDDCVRVLVAEVARDMDATTTSGPRIAVLFGTHNWKSSRLVLDEMVRVGLGKVVDGLPTTTTRIGAKIVLSKEVRQRVCMAQLYGMSDSLAAYLVDRTSSPTHFNSGERSNNQSLFVIRYVPYGPLRDVMPYLARRAVENRSVLGSSGKVCSTPDSSCVSRGGSLDLMGKDLGDEDERGPGGAVEERKRMGRLIWERVVGFLGR